MPNGWRVVKGGQRFTERYMPNNQFESVAEVQIVADDGAYYTLVLPMAQYTAQAVNVAGDAWYEQHQQVNALGNE
jgi:hypothetical protein